MTREETLCIMGVLKAAYPAYYRDLSRRDAETVVGLWTEMFADDPAQMVAAAVKALIATDAKGYPPHIGAVKDKLRKLEQPREMTELEAWALVRQAIRGASMEPWSRRLSAASGVDSRTSAERNFARLPPLLQKLVGSPAQLAEWGKVEEDKLGTVVQSNFMRSYRARAAQERELAALPGDVKAMLGRMRALAMPEGGQVSE